MTRRLLAPLAPALAALTLASAAAAAPADPPWRAAQEIQDGLFAAQSGLILDPPAVARREVERAARGYRGPLRRSIAAADPAADRAVRQGLRQAAAAAAAGDDVALAAARGAVRAGVLRGAYAATLEAVEADRASAARGWLLLREFRTATRFTRPGADGTLAVERLAHGEERPARAAATVRKDLLDAYQARLRELLDDAVRGAEHGLPVRVAEAAAQAEGYFAILAPRYEHDRGAAETEKATNAFAALRAAAIEGASPARIAGLEHRAAATLEGFTAAPFTPAEAARRAQQLLRFVALVPVEYGRGVSDDRVTKDFEIQEAAAFHKGGAAALADLQAQLARRSPREAAVAGREMRRLGALVQGAVDHPGRVASADEVEHTGDAADKALRAAMPDAWEEQTDQSDYDLIALTLDRVEAAVGAGQYRQAEQARLEAYAFFEFGPERRLKAFDPGLGLDIEGLVWFGADGAPGLATLISKHAPRREIHETRLELDRRLADAAATLGDSSSSTTVVVNSAILVFREGLEAVLILAAIMASLVGARARLRRPIFLGAGLGLLASIVTWALAESLIGALDQSGEKLEAVTGLIAIGVLLLVTNWFFHRVYWSEWIGRFHRRRKRLEKIDRTGFLSGQAIGFVLLGLTSVYREGFETVLFLQSLQVSAGTATVLEGALLGLALTFAVGAVTFLLERKLPYKRMLVFTGVLIGVVLIVMVGQTARTMQGVGWLPITPVGSGEFPYTLGLWFGIYPTWETIGAQIAAAVFVVGSYVLAREIRVHRPSRRARRERRERVPAAG